MGRSYKVIRRFCRKEVKLVGKLGKLVAGSSLLVVTGRVGQKVCFGRAWGQVKAKLLDKLRAVQNEVCLNV